MSPGISIYSNMSFSRELIIIGQTFTLTLHAHKYSSTCDFASVNDYVLGRLDRFFTNDTQDAYGTAFITHRIRNGRRKVIPAKYSFVKQASSPNQNYDVPRPVPIRKRPHLANVVLYAKVRNFFFSSSLCAL